MVKSLSICLLLVLSACAPKLPPPYVEAELAPYLEQYRADKFRYHADSNIARISIRFAPLLDQGYLGMCYYGRDRLIEIDPVVWQASNEDARVSLMYHELGHCDLDLDHVDGVSLMNKYGLNGYTFSLDRERYIGYLFLEGR